MIDLVGVTKLRFFYNKKNNLNNFYTIFLRPVVCF